MSENILLSHLLEKIPTLKGSNSRALEQQLKNFNKKIVVLDDDPTGIQTVHGVSVFTDWSKESMVEGFNEQSPVFFILTNSRSLKKEQTRKVHTEIAYNIMYAANKTNKDYIVVSRSDSTLRGHYPLETEILKQCIEHQSGTKIHGEIIIPFFKEGGRVTVFDTHYVVDGEKAIPAGKTEFARDTAFGYKSSNLKEWVEEKTIGRYSKDNVFSVSLEMIREENFTGIKKILDDCWGFSKIVVNAVEYQDLENFCIPLIFSINKGKRFIFRTAASFVRVVSGIPQKPLLEAKDLVRKHNNNGGLVVIGSHVNKTTRQLEALKDCRGIENIEFNQHTVLDNHEFQGEIQRVIDKVEKAIISGITAVVYTRRDKIHGASSEEDLDLAASISRGLVSIIKNLKVEPAFLIAKGGITSSDIGTEGLGVKKSLVAGQVLPGIPVWLTGKESKFPDMAYIIFPGNVGNDNTLKDIITSCMEFTKQIP